MFTEDERLEKATPTTRALYHLFKQAILKIADDISFRPTKKHIGLWASNRRIANFTINIQSFKIWINVPPGELNNDNGQTNRTKSANTINVSSSAQLSQVLDWLRQAYNRKN
jgi:predicted transport protein